MEKENYSKENILENNKDKNNNLTYEINKFNNNFNKSFSSKDFRKKKNYNENLKQFQNNLALSIKNNPINSDIPKLLSSIKSDNSNLNDIRNFDNNDDKSDYINYKKYFININGNIKNEERKNKLNSNFDLEYKDINCEEGYDKLNTKILKLKKQNNSLINKINEIKKKYELSKLKLDEKQKEIIMLQSNSLKLKDIIKQKDDYISSLKEMINNLKNTNSGKDKNIELLSSKLLNFEKEEKNHINTIELLNNAEIKNRYLKEEINSIKKYGDKSENLLIILFNFYNKIDYLLNYSPDQKWKRKEILNDVINYENLEDFEEKLNKLIKKLEKNIEEIRLRIGKYFPCDITCCTTKNERMKYFKK